MNHNIATVDGIQFGLLSRQQIIDRSTVKVIHSTLNDKKFERKQGVNCPTTGTSDRGVLCLTCSDTIQGCPTHPTYIDLCVPCHNRTTRDVLPYLFRIICFGCSRLRLRAEPARLLKIVKTYKDIKKRLQILAQESIFITTCGQSRAQRQKVNREEKKAAKRAQKEHEEQKECTIDGTDGTGSGDAIDEDETNGVEEMEQDEEEGEGEEEEEIPAAEEEVENEEGEELTTNDDIDEDGLPEENDDDNKEEEEEEEDKEEDNNSDQEFSTKEYGIENDEDEEDEDSGGQRAGKKTKQQQSKTTKKIKVLLTSSPVVVVPGLKRKQQKEKIKKPKKNKKDTVIGEVEMSKKSEKRLDNSDDEDNDNNNNNNNITCCGDSFTGCGQIQPKYKLVNGNIKVTFAYPICGQKKLKFPRCNPYILYQKLSCMTDEDIKLIGMDPILSHPQSLMWTAMPVLEKGARLSSVKNEGNKTRHHDDLTIKYQAINRINTRLEAKLAEEKWVPRSAHLPNYNVEYLWVENNNNSSNKCLSISSSSSLSNGNGIQPCTCNSSLTHQFCQCFSSSSHSNNNNTVKLPQYQQQQQQQHQNNGGDIKKQEQQNGRKPKKQKTCVELMQLMQAEIDCLLFGDVKNTGRAEKPIRSIKLRLVGKKGRIRDNIMGRRQNFSARTVVDPDPSLDGNQIGVPFHITRTLTYPEKVTQWNIYKLTNLFRKGEVNYIDRGDGILLNVKYLNKSTFLLQEGWTVERHLQDGDIILVNRQPSLHKASMMSFYVKRVSGRALRLPLCVTDGFNADFDGDEMNLFLPLDEMTRAEAIYLMLSQNQIVTSQNGRPINTFKQNTLIAPYYLTSCDQFLDESDFMHLLFAFGDVEVEEEKPHFAKHLSSSLKKPAVQYKNPQTGEWCSLWTGKQLFSSFLPVHFQMGELKGASGGLFKLGELWPLNKEPFIIHQSELICGRVTDQVFGSVVGSVPHIIFRDYGASIAHRYISGMHRLLNAYVKMHGITVAPSHLFNTASNMTNEILKKGLEYTDQVSYQGYTPSHLNLISFIQNKLSGNEQLSFEAITKNDEIFKKIPQFHSHTDRERHILDILGKIREYAGQHILEQWLHRMSGSDANMNGLVNIIRAGAKGKTLNLTQLVFGLGHQMLSGQRMENVLPHFNICSSPTIAQGMIVNSFDKGLNLTEYYAHAMCGRDSLLDTAAKTSETGYIHRCLVKAMENVKIHYDRSVRSHKKIYQFAYGEDGMDPAFTERMSSQLIDAKNNDELDKNYYMGGWSYDLFKSFEHVFHKMSKEAQQRWIKQCLDKEVQKIFVEERTKLQEARYFLLFNLCDSGEKELDFTFVCPIPYARIWNKARAMHSSSSSCSSIMNCTPYELLCKTKECWLSLEKIFTEHTAWYIRDQKEFLKTAAAHLLPLTNKGVLKRVYTWNEILFLDWCHIGKQLKLHGPISIEMWNYIETEFKKFCNASFMQPGEMVGALASQSAGEPLTQMTMKTFHYAGNSHNLITGIPRMKQMLNARKVQLGTSMKFYLKKNISLEQCKRFCTRLPVMMLQHYIKNTKILEVGTSEANYWNNEDQYLLSPPSSLDTIHNNNNNNNIVSSDNKPSTSLSTNNNKNFPFILRLELNKSKCLKTHLSPQEVSIKILDYLVWGLRGHQANADDIQYIHLTNSGTYDNHWIIRIEFDKDYSYLDHFYQQLPSSSTHHHVHALWKNFLYHMLQSVPVHGIQGIKSAEYEATSITTVNPETGERIKEERWLVETQGSNFKRVAKLKEVDYKYCTTNNIHEILTCLGIHALKHWLEESMEQTMKENGTSVNRRHIKLLSVTMTRNGIITRITREGINAQDESVLRKAAFEEPVKQLEQGALAARKDLLKGVTEAIIMGTPHHFGTGMIKCLPCPSTSSAPLSMKTQIPTTITPEMAWRNCQLVLGVPKDDWAKRFLPPVAEFLDNSLNNGLNENSEIHDNTNNTTNSDDHRNRRLHIIDLTMLDQRFSQSFSYSEIEAQLWFQKLL